MGTTLWTGGLDPLEKSHFMVKALWKVQNADSVPGKRWVHFKIVKMMADRCG